EILGLRWSDIDLKAARLTVNQSLERLGGKTTFKPPKTAGSRGTNTPPALTVEALSAHRAEQARIGAGELVFSHGGDTVGPGQPHQGLRQIDPGHGGKAHHLSRSASYPYLPPADGWGACEGGE